MYVLESQDTIFYINYQTKLDTLRFQKYRNIIYHKNEGVKTKNLSDPDARFIRSLHQKFFFIVFTIKNTCKKDRDVIYYYKFEFACLNHYETTDARPLWTDPYESQDLGYRCM